MNKNLLRIILFWSASLASVSLSAMEAESAEQLLKSVVREEQMVAEQEQNLMSVTEQVRVVESSDIGRGTNIIDFSKQNLKAIEGVGSLLVKVGNIYMPIDEVPRLELFLWFNRLDHISAEMGILKNIVRLEVSHNPLKRFPQVLGMLTGLQNLGLRNTQLKEVPAQIGQLVNLEYLYLSQNQLSFLPVEIGSCIRLKGLMADNNQLSEIPASLENLKELSIIDLSDNKFKEPSAELQVLSKLTDIWLAKNPMIFWPARIGALEHRIGAWGQLEPGWYELRNA